MSLTKQNPLMIILPVIILFSLPSYLCQQQIVKLLTDESRNQTSSVFNQTRTTGKALEL